MVQMTVEYNGGLRCTLTHGPSGAVISTDAPKDNHGKGESFSPTDLVSAALGACMLTIMGIYAKNHGLAIDGTTLQVTKGMVADPDRRIGKLTVVMTLPAGIPKERRAALENAAHTCPVNKSLRSDIEVPVQFNYPD